MRGGDPHDCVAGRGTLGVNMLTTSSTRRVARRHRLSRQQYAGVPVDDALTPF